MTLDLSPLESAAARAGLAGLRARIVPPDRRRGTWFTWDARELLVSERIVDRCPPEDACALLVGEILRQRHVRRLAWPFALGVAVVVALLALLALRLDLGALARVAIVAGLAGLAVACWLALRLKAGLAADDEAVALLGDATPLVRGLNLMNEEELRIGGRRLPARPDLHWRAERLARVHRLCDGGGGGG